MRKGSKFLIFFILNLLFNLNSGAARKIIVGIDENYPPHEYIENNEIKGFNIDILKAISPKIGVEIEFYATEWNKLFDKLKAGELDALFMAYSKEREEYFDFTEENLLDICIAIFVNVETVGIDNIKKLAFHTVAVEESDISHSIIRNEVPDAITIPVKTQFDGLELLRKREVFAFLGNKYTGIYLIYKNNWDEIKIIGDEIKIGPRKIAVKKGDIQLKKALDKGLKVIKESGEYDFIYKKWFGIEILKYRRVLRYLVYIIFIFLILIIFVILWNRILKIRIEKKAKEITEIERSYREIFNGIPHCLIICDKSNRIILVNPACERILHTKVNNIINKDLFEIPFFKLNKRKLTRFLSDLKFNVIANDNFLYKIHQREHIIQVTAYRYNMHLGEVTLIILHDITARHNLAQRMQYIEKMETLGRFVGTISHDFNNILTSLSSLTELMLAKNNIPFEIRRDLESMNKITEKAITLINRLLVFSKKEVVTAQNVNLNTLLRGFKPILSRMLPENITVEYYLDENLFNIRFDPVQFEQIILNLASNSKDAMPEGGKILIETKNVEFDEKYIKEHPEVKGGKYCMLSFSDTGQGIPKEIIERIFEPFFTTKKEGTGLGLSTVYGIVSKFNGYINVYSESGKGTTFKIYFPAITGAEVMKKAKDTIEPVVIPKILEEKNILLIEDDADIRNLVTRFLKELKVNIYSAKNGEAALNLLKIIAQPIHILIVDLVLPDMSGKEIAERIKDEYPDLKILYISGYTENVITKNGILENGINFLQKPFTLKELYKKLLDIL